MLPAGYLLRAPPARGFGDGGGEDDGDGDGDGNGVPSPLAPLPRGEGKEMAGLRRFVASISIFTATARGLRRTLESMATPCSVMSLAVYACHQST